MDIDLFDAFEGASAPTQPRRRSGANSTSASAGGPGSGVSQKRKLETNSHEGDVGANDASSAHVPVSSNRSGLDKRHRTEADDAASSMEIMGAQQVTSGPSAGAGTLVSIDPSTTAAARPRAVDYVPAKVYPFQLDTFQREAISYIENEESVLVAAHTSAG
jgi:superfamily II RNA helicase